MRPDHYRLLLLALRLLITRLSNDRRPLIAFIITIRHHCLIYWHYFCIHLLGFLQSTRP